MAHSGQIEFQGRGWRLFWLALSRMALTILTFGLARFWMITRLRRYYWSSLTVGGAPLEYTGRAGEKFIGFLIAVVILAIYLTVVNLVLGFVGLAYFQGNPLALNVSFITVLPLAFWAQYRARRYILARSRWRGIRFGVDQGAWGYVVAAIWWWSVTILTLGLLYPWKQLALSRYVTNRSWFGDAQFRQAARLWPLMRSWLWVWSAVVVTIIGITSYFENTEALLASAQTSTETAAAAGKLLGAAFALAALGPLWVILFLYLRYRVVAFNYLYSQTTLGGAQFAAELRMWSVLRVYVVGYVLMVITMAVIGSLALVVGVVGLTSVGADTSALDALREGNMPSALTTGVLILPAVIYLLLIAFYTALRHAWIVRPMVRAIAASTTILNSEALDDVRQRAHDEQAEAGGFADALGADPGGAF